MTAKPPSTDTAKDPVGKKDAFAVQAPSISLPKGGGAIRGIGEEFSPSPVTGTGSMSVPLAVSPGRSGFAPELSIAYDSGAGNGPFGFGWSLSLPSISRKTSKGLPRYRDLEDSDTFILTGADDLVQEFEKDDQGQWVKQNGRFVIDEKIRTVEGVDYAIRRYRPRIEGLFSRLERWTRVDDPNDVHWRSITRDNVLTLYGKSADTRIANPDNPDQIFSWLICETRDDKGNAIVYGYREEDGLGAPLAHSHQRNRGAPDSPRRRSNRYPKRILYGNRTSMLDAEGKRKPIIGENQIEDADWMFEVVFDYGDHNEHVPLPAADADWSYRTDPFSSYRSGFEVRTCRLCRRVLMFHHFAGEPGVEENCLVSSTEFSYSDAVDPAGSNVPVYTFLTSVTRNGYVRDGDGYLKRSIPPLEFVYSKPVIQDRVETADKESLENLPAGLENTVYQWTDLHGEGIPGILTEQAGGWFYKRNLSPMGIPSENEAAGPRLRLGPMELAKAKPNAALGGGAMFMDLAGDGQPDVVLMDTATPGFYEHDQEEGWKDFRPFTSRLNRVINDPNLRFVDLTGDGHADILITEDDAFLWHLSEAEAGFGPEQRVSRVLDEEYGPRVLFADDTESILLADMSGDGLTDIARVRNGEVSYWPNLGYGRFGAKVTMDNSPRFDQQDQFNHRRIRAADIDGSGSTDIIYLHRDGVRLYFNQSGNGWSKAAELDAFPGIDDLANIATADLTGNGTTCLVWSSPLPGNAARPLRYVNLMGNVKPHLMVGSVNNLGSETVVHYAPSTRFYLQDKFNGKPWITRLPFPVHVVERVETYDHISRNRFVTRYAYHHGYFDGEEREFRGFGMVEQWDTEHFAALSESTTFPTGSNVDTASQVPPSYTRTWFHTGAHLGGNRISDFYAGLTEAKATGEYFREPGLTPEEARALLLEDTILPAGLDIDEEREACRALKGSMLRQETYALDNSDKSAFPYSVTEQNFSIRFLQPRGSNPNAVFFTHQREVLNFHYERNPDDPRIQHELTLKVDEYGNSLAQASIAYGRRQPDPNLPLDIDRIKQTRTRILYTENKVTNAVDHPEIHPNDYHLPLPAESITYELTGFKPENNAARFSFGEWVRNNLELATTAAEIRYEQTADNNARQKRQVEHIRSLYRRDDLASLLPLGELQPLALPGEAYKLAFTPGLIATVFQRNGQPLLPDPGAVLGAQGADGGGFLASQDLKNAELFPESDPDDHWWLPSGRVFLSPDPAHTAANELDFARTHFFLAHRIRDSFHTVGFGTETVVRYDVHDLLTLETIDPVGNRITVGERLPNGDRDPNQPGNDYRTLQPMCVTDRNRNRTKVTYDALGFVTATALLGKPEEGLGDSLAGFSPDVSEAGIISHFSDPLADPDAILGQATTRFVYDLFAYHRTRSQPDPAPVAVCLLSRETHESDLQPDESTRIQQSFSYSDGFGREIQNKIKAEAGPVVEGGPTIEPRWVGSGWTVFNNKGKPVRQYEPFFSGTHRFEFGIDTGVSPILFYDPMDRVIATLHPNHTFEKVVFSPWIQIIWDANDTVTDDPRTDPDIASLTAGYFASLPAGDWQSWHAQRAGGGMGGDEMDAAEKAAAHAGTPTINHFDALGRPFLTETLNRVSCANHDLDGTEETIRTRLEVDIEGNDRAVRDSVEQNGDAGGRVVMQYDYDLLENRIRQTSMDSGSRWILNDAAGKPLRSWNDRGHASRTTYDPMRRPISIHVSGTNPGNPDQEILTQLSVYGEQHPQAEPNNLRGSIYLHLDQAGAETTELMDFKQNTLRASRRLAKEFKSDVDWSPVGAVIPADAADSLDPGLLNGILDTLLEDEIFSGLTTFDALNRPVVLIPPHTPAMKPSMIRPGYNDSSLLERLEINLRDAREDGQPVWNTFVRNIDYDAKGRRQRIDYGNGVSTIHIYDPLTFRLMNLRTRRDAGDFPDDCPDPPPAGWPGCRIQNFHYTYDPAGNITHIRDDAQQAIFFRNNRVDPAADYTYDAVYRLIQATGREHLGQAGGAPVPHSHNDSPRAGIDWAANDGNAMGNYVERYVHDTAGNFLEMQHRGSDPAHPGWTRHFSYQESSLIEDGTGNTTLKTCNRLSNTRVGNNNPTVNRYLYDTHGNTTRVPHLGGAHPASNLHWNHSDQLRQADLGGGGTSYYTYGSAGQRVRKVWEKSPNLIEERIYLGDVEIFRRKQGSGAILLERETLHVTEDENRIAMVETRTVNTNGNDPAPVQLTRFQFSSHLGSSALELDEQAQIISYEEYTPFGSTSYQAVRIQTETPKRYRFTGKERDEESGFADHGARLYASWLARWLSVDPMGIKDGTNVYYYVRNNPVILHDPSGTNSDNFKVGKAWEREILGKVGEKIPLVEQVTVTATIDGKKVTSTLDALGRDADGWIVVESKLGKTTKLSDAQKAIQQHLQAGKEVTIQATDKAKIKELRSKLGVSSKTPVSTSRYKIVHQGNAGQVLADLNAIPKGHSTILHQTGELTVHTPDEMKKIAVLKQKYPSSSMKDLVDKAKKASMEEVEDMARAMARKSGSGSSATRRRPRGKGLKAKANALAVVIGLGISLAANKARAETNPTFTDKSVIVLDDILTYTDPAFYAQYFAEKAAEKVSKEYYNELSKWKAASPNTPGPVVEYRMLRCMFGVCL